MANVNVKDPRDIQGAQEEHFNSLKKAEQSPNQSYMDAGIDQAEAFANDPNNASDEVRNKEESGAGDDAAWTTNRSAQPKQQEVTGKSKLKKSAPYISIVTLLFGGGFGIITLLSPATLLLHIKETITGKFDHQSTVLERRTNKILAKKLTSTKGCSGIITISCKFNKMSNKMLQSMSDAGIVPVDKNGNPMDLKNGKWGSQRPAGFKNPTGELDLSRFPNKTVDAKNLSKFLTDNPEAAGLFRKAFNPTWSSFWDSTYKNFLVRVGFKDKGPKIDGNDEKSVDKSIQTTTDGNIKDSGFKATPSNDPVDPNNPSKAPPVNQVSQAGATDLNSAVDTAAKSTIKDLSGKISKATSSPLMLVNLFCLAKDSSQIGKALRIVQMGQLITFGLLFLQVADEIKAGTAKPEVVSAVGDKFTQALNGPDGKLLQKSAMESDGMNYALNGDTSMLNSTKKSTTSVSSYTKFIPGGGAAAILFTIGQWIKNKLGNSEQAVSAACGALNSTIGAAGQILLDFTPIGAILGGAGLILGATGALDGLIAPLFQMLAGKIVDSTVANEDFGNASASGMIQTVTEGGNAGGMMPLTVPQAQAYAQLTSETQLADAKIDQATLSPLDASSPNTFLGSIVTQMLPYYGATSSGLVGTMSAVMKLVTTSFSSILTSRTFAAAPDYTSCPDPSITSVGIAAGPVCDVQYGIPAQYLNIDPDENLTYLQNKGLVDTNGNTSGDLKTYIDTCALGDGGGSDPACIIDSEPKARYALYHVDHRIQKDMDGEDDTLNDPTGTPTSGVSSSSSSTSTTAPDATKIPSYCGSNYGASLAPTDHSRIACSAWKLDGMQYQQTRPIQGADFMSCYLSNWAGACATTYPTTGCVGGPTDATVTNCARSTDCSGLALMAIRDGIGLDLISGGISDTAGMGGSPHLKPLASFDNAQPGDIALNPGTHTEVITSVDKVNKTYTTIGEHDWGSPASPATYSYGAQNLQPYTVVP